MLLAYKRGRRVELYSRNRLRQNVPAIEAAVRALPAREVILDGEMTWDGRSRYHVFDILWLNDKPVTLLPLEDRRALLELRDLLAELGLPSWVKTSGSKGFHILVPLDGKTPMEQAARLADAVGGLCISRAPVSAPCTWEEIERGRVEPATFTLKNMRERIATMGDVWGDMRRRGRSLGRAIAKLRKASKST